MPIGEAHKSGESFSGLCEYILAQGIYASESNSKKPEIIFRNQVFASDYLSLGKEFREQAKENQRVKKPVMHLTVNFKTADEISTKNQKLFVQKILKEMGVKKDNYQYAVVKHNDKHPHYHIVINRVGLDGVTLTDSNTKLRIGTAVDKIEKEMGLDNYLEKTRAYVYDPVDGYKKNENRELKKGLPTIKLVKDRKIGIQEKKNFVQKNVLKILDDPRTSTITSLKIQLSFLGIELKHTINIKQQMAVSFRYQGVAIKGTQIQLKGAIIKKQLDANRDTLNQIEAVNDQKQLLFEMASKSKASMEDIISKYKSGHIPNLKDSFAKNGILFDGKSKLLYKENAIEIMNLTTFENYCKERLKSAQLIYSQKTEKFNTVLNQKYKNGVFGLLTAEQRKFNEVLRVQKNALVKPSLEVKLNVDDIHKILLEPFGKVINDVKEMPIDNFGAYLIDYNFLEESKEIKIEKIEQQKEYSSPSSIFQQNQSSSEEDEEPIRKRKFRR